MRVLTRFTFPRQPHDEHLCLADYFAPVESGVFDVVAFQVVTVGQAATGKFDSLQAANDYTEALASRTGWPCRPPKPLPNTCTGTSAANWGCPKDAASATRGATRPSPTWKTTARVLRPAACRARTGHERRARPINSSRNNPPRRDCGASPAGQVLLGWREPRGTVDAVSKRSHRLVRSATPVL